MVTFARVGSLVKQLGGERQIKPMKPSPPTHITARRRRAGSHSALAILC